MAAVRRHGQHLVPLSPTSWSGTGSTWSRCTSSSAATAPSAETDITDYDAFFEELRAAESLPTTSQPSVGDFTSVYEPLLADGGEVVSVHISGGLSGTAESARRAAETLERDGKGGERVHVFDSTTAAGGLGLLVLAAAARRRAGPRRAGDQSRASAEARSELRLWFSIDTLEFLRRGGRIGAASAWIGSTLRVKPILTVQNEMTPVERVRTSSRAFERMVDYARQCHDSGADGWCAQHINAPEHPRAAGGARPGDLRVRAQPSRARSARCSPRTPARGCSASGGLPLDFLP